MVESQHPTTDDEGPQLPGRQPCWILGGKIDPNSASRYITTLVHAHILGPVDAWREFPVPVRDLLYDMFTRRYAFTRPEDLPRARTVWESTAQTNLRKSMYEARDKAMKTTSSWNPMASLDYDPVWLRMDYWESLCHRWATGPCIMSSSVPLLFASYLIGLISGRGPMTMSVRVLAQLLSVAPLAYASSFAVPLGSGVEEIRTLIREELREELRTHFGVIVEQLISAMQGVRPSQPSPQ
ncbi:hypothetical protein Taro_004061, partial [Colocasia esculenta]|nr:hypothetical protein [Colocasia esculenta]